jgi:hypothetical protein
MGQTTFSGPVKSDNGFIENSFSTSERDAIPSPVVGLLIYNTDTNIYEVYGNSGWQPAFSEPVVLPLPNITTFTPTSGTTAGGTALTVSGSNFLFDGNPNVDFANIDFGSGIVYNVTNIVVNSDTEFTCETTASFGGAYTGGHLKAYNADNQTGTASSTTFDYAAPVFVTPFSYSVVGDYNNGTPGTEGVSYEGDHNAPQDPAFLYANPVSWSNTAGFDNLILQPSGSSGTVTLNQGTFAYTTTTDWTLTQWGYYQVQVTGEIKSSIHGGGSVNTITG